MLYAVCSGRDAEGIRLSGHLVDGGEWRSRSGFSALGCFVVSMSMDVHNV